jgi:tetratricopeptide (TPR) repeat protein|tara:strand:+ start:9765 stop:10415 length:651 start_codon:yes stop_codon:yes gene_type:complete
MLGLAIVTLLGGLAIFYRRSIDDIRNDFPTKLAEKLDKLWSIAQESLREKKYLRAEKALLTILRVDARNATAYNRLGILYAKQQAYKDAIECFEIAQSLEPNASSLHNVGLIYYETGDYTKAALAFEQALRIETDISARHIAYAKVQEKLGNEKKMIESLERAVEIDPIPQTLKFLAEAYERVGQAELAEKLRARAAKMIIPEGQAKQVTQPRKVI